MVEPWLGYADELVNDSTFDADELDIEKQETLWSQLGRRAHPLSVPLQLRLHLKDQAANLKRQE